MVEMVGAMIGVVGDDHRAGAQAAFDQREDVAIERLRAIEQQQVDPFRQVDGERRQGVALTELDEIGQAEGAQRFTTARVAERAGVSVGSLYRYFPNKAAILFRLQGDDWRRISALSRTILEDRTVAPLDRLRALVHAFIRSECEEAQVRGALNDAAPLYRDAPEAAEVRAAPRSFDAIVAALKLILERFRPAECANYLRHSGYVQT